MTIYTAPQVAPAPDVFLAGGIQGTHVWQDGAGQWLSGVGLTVANPRREGLFDCPDSEPDQIRWEACHLERSRVILFWFPGPGDHPIAMYELGRWAATTKPIVVGSPYDYSRRTNIVTQLSLLRPGLAVHTNMQDLLNAALKELH